MKKNLILIAAIFCVGLVWFFSRQPESDKVVDKKNTFHEQKTFDDTKLQVTSETETTIEEIEHVSEEDKEAPSAQAIPTKPAFDFDIKIKNINKVPQDIRDGIKSTIIEPEKDAKLLPFKILNDEWLEEECEEVHYCLNRYISGDDSWEYNAIVVKQLGLMRIAEKKEGRFYLPDMSEGVYWVYLKLKNKPTQFVQVLKMDDVFRAQVRSGLSLQVKLTGNAVEFNKLKIRVSKKRVHSFNFWNNSDTSSLDLIVFDSLVDVDYVNLSLPADTYVVQFYKSGYLSREIKEISLNVNHTIVLNLDEFRFYQIEHTADINKFNDDFSVDNKEIVIDHTTKYFTSSEELSELTSLLHKNGWRGRLNKESKVITVEKDDSRYVQLILKDQFGNDISDVVEFTVVRIDLGGEKKDENTELLSERHKSSRLARSVGAPNIFISHELVNYGEIEILYFVDPEKKYSYKYKINKETQLIKQTLVLDDKFYGFIRLRGIDVSTPINSINVFEDGLNKKFSTKALDNKNILRVILKDLFSRASREISYREYSSVKKRFFFNFKQINSLFKISAEGYDRTEDFSLESEEFKDIELKKSQVVYFKLLDSIDLPLKNKRARILVDNLNGSVENREVLTDENGCFMLFVNSSRFKVQFKSEHNDVFVAQSYLYTAENPLVVNSYPIQSYTIRDQASQPVVGAAVFLKTYDLITAGDYEGYFSYVMVKYTGLKGEVSFASNKGRLVGAFHPSEGVCSGDKKNALGEVSAEVINQPVQLNLMPGRVQSLRFYKGEDEDNDTVVEIALLDGVIRFFSKVRVFDEISKYLGGDSKISINSNNPIAIIAGEDDVTRGDAGSVVQVCYPLRGKRLEIISAFDRKTENIRLNISISGSKKILSTKLVVDKNFMSYSFDELNWWSNLTIRVSDLNQLVKFSLSIEFQNPYASYTCVKEYKLNDLPEVISLTLEKNQRKISVLDSSNQPILALTFLGRMDKNPEGPFRHLEAVLNDDHYLIEESELSRYHEIKVVSKGYETKVFEVSKLSEINNIIILQSSSLLLVHYDVEESEFVSFNPDSDNNGIGKSEKLSSEKKFFETRLSEGYWQVVLNDVASGVHIKRGADASIRFKRHAAQKFNYSFNYMDQQNLLVQSYLEGLCVRNRSRERTVNGYSGSFMLFYNHVVVYFLEDSFVIVPLGFIKNGEKIKIDLGKDVYKESPSALYYKLFKRQPFNFCQRAEWFNLSLIQQVSPFYQLIEEDDRLDIKKYSSASDLILRNPTRGLISKEASFELPKVKVQQEWLIFKDFGHIELNSKQRMNFKVDCVGDEILAYILFSNDGVYVAENPSGVIRLTDKNKIITCVFDVKLNAKKGIVALYAEKYGACIPIEFDHILGEFLGGRGSRGDADVYNLGEKISFRANGVPVGRYHFVVFDPETDTSYSSASFEVTSQTKELSLDIK